MKKYFLLATTTLLLSTSNVMAAPDVAQAASAVINIGVKLKTAASVEVLEHADFGTLYLNSFKGTSDGSNNTYAEIAVFTNSQEYANVDSKYVAHITGSQVGVIQVTKNGNEGLTPVLSSPSVSICNGVDFVNANLGFVNDIGDVQTYFLTGTLIVDMAAHDNEGTASLTVSMNY